MALKIYELEFDEFNEDELAQHGVRAVDVRQVLDNEPVVLPNKKGRAADWIMIGPTYGGRFLTVPIASLSVEGMWRPVTAWNSEPEEIAKYHAARRR